MPQTQTSMKDLLEAGVHFGHQSKRWNPKMKPFIFTARNGVHVIDLAKTAPMLDAAADFVRDQIAQGKSIIFVGSKKQARHIVKEQAQRVGAMYMTERWIGGLLTNFDSIKKSLKKLETLKAQRDANQLSMYTKKERAGIDHEIARLERQLGGIADLRQLPDLLFVIDPRKEENAVLEAKLVGIPVVAVVDTNCDPTNIAYPIPGNDDAIKSITLFVQHIADAVEEGMSQRKAETGTQQEDKTSLKPATRNPEPTLSQDALPAKAKEARDIPPAGAKAKGPGPVETSGESTPQMVVEDAPHTDNAPVETSVEEQAAGVPTEAEAEAEEAMSTTTAPKKSASKTKATTATTKTSKEPKAKK